MHELVAAGVHDRETLIAAGAALVPPEQALETANNRLAWQRRRHNGGVIRPRRERSTEERTATGARRIARKALDNAVRDGTMIRVGTVITAGTGVANEISVGNEVSLAGPAPLVHPRSRARWTCILLDAINNGVHERDQLVKLARLGVSEGHAWRARNRVLNSQRRQYERRAAAAGRDVSEYRRREAWIGHELDIGAAIRINASITGLLKRGTIVERDGDLYLPHQVESIPAATPENGSKRWANDIAMAHTVRFRKVSNRFPRRVSEAYGFDQSRALADSDDQVADVVAMWERANGLTPRDWPAIGRAEGRP